jgi:hypothetical protein
MNKMNNRIYSLTASFILVRPELLFVKSIIGLIIPGVFAGQGFPNEYPIVWLDDRPPPISLIMSSTNSI